MSVLICVHEYSNALIILLITVSENLLRAV